jgi:hypothetical protein
MSMRRLTGLRRLKCAKLPGLEMLLCRVVLTRLVGYTIQKTEGQHV